MLIDRAILDDLASALGRAQTAGLVRLYLKHSRDKLTAWDLTDSRVTPEQHRHVVHSLRGGSLQLGTDELVSLCTSLEEDLRATGRRLTLEELERLRATFEDTHAALSSWLGEA